MRLRPGPAALLGCSLIAACVASLDATTTHAATVINTSAVRVSLDLRDPIDGLQQVFVTVTCSPVSINPPIDTETALLIPDVPVKDLRFPAFTPSTTCKIDAVVTSSPTVGGLAVDVNGTVVAGPIVAQQISVSGVVPGLSPLVKIVLSKVALPVATPTSATTASTISATSATSATSTTVAPAQATTTSTALTFSAPGADASSVGSVPAGATSTTSVAPTTATPAPSTTIALVQARQLAVPLARTVAIVTTTTSRVAKIARPTTTVKKPAAKKLVKTKPTTTVRKKTKTH